MREFLCESLGDAESWWGMEVVGLSCMKSLAFEVVDAAHYTRDMLHEMKRDTWLWIMDSKVFSVFRNPYNRAVSAYSQFMKHYGSFASHMAPTLEHYLMCVRDGRYKCKKSGFLYIHGVPQTEFHFPHHILLSGEDFSDSLSCLFGKRLSFSNKETPTRELSSRERSLVETIYRRDMKLWDEVN